MAKNPDTAIRSFRVPRDLLDWLTVEADAENRSVNNLVVHLLDTARATRAVQRREDAHLPFDVDGDRRASA